MALKDKKYIIVEDLITARSVASANVVWNLTTMASEYKYDKKTGEIVLGAQNPSGKMVYLRIIPLLENPEATPGGISVKWSTVNSAINYPANEKPADGCHFLRLRFSVKKDMTQRLRCVIVPEGDAMPTDIDNLIK